MGNVNKIRRDQGARKSKACHIHVMAPISNVSGRSIKHCCQLVGHHKASVGRKYNGEYCQIHIQRSGAEYDINIFSKSGRDLTQDRVALQ